MKKTTLNKLIKDKCYCMKQDKDILLKECNLFNCKRWKKCMQKSNADINKDLKRRDKNGEKTQK
jgi:hypothetical protein